MVEFSDPKESLLYVPAILIKPRIPATGRLDGLSLLTHTASAQMLNYHHRLLVFLKPKDALIYLMQNMSPQERFDFLVSNRYVPEFEVSTDRKMAKGWDKKVEGHESSLQAETSYIEALRREGICG